MAWGVAVVKELWAAHSAPATVSTPQGLVLLELCGWSWQVGWKMLRNWRKMGCKTHPVITWLVRLVGWSCTSRTFLRWAIWMIGYGIAVDHQIFLVFLSAEWAQGAVQLLTTQCFPFPQYFRLQVCLPPAPSTAGELCPFSLNMCKFTAPVPSIEGFHQDPRRPHPFFICPRGRWWALSTGSVRSFFQDNSLPIIYIFSLYVSLFFFFCNNSYYFWQVSWIFLQIIFF